MNRMAGQEGAAGFMPLGEALAHAERCRYEGRLAEAEAVCRQILLAQPDLPEAEHLLGVIAHQSGELGEAIEHVRRAVRLAPQVALFHANLGEMLRLAGRPELAVEEARRALAIEPNLPAALSNLGVALYELKHYEEAARVQRQAIAANPGFAETGPAIPSTSTITAAPSKCGCWRRCWPCPAPRMRACNSARARPSSSSSPPRAPARARPL